MEQYAFVEKDEATEKRQTSGAKKPDLQQLKQHERSLRNLETLDSGFN